MNVPIERKQFQRYPFRPSERCYIGLGQATQTLKVTTQQLMRSAILPLARRYRTDGHYERSLQITRW